MGLEGGCYCRAVRYAVEGDALFKGQCHCRECQYISGGHPNVAMGVRDSDFRYTQGRPKEFRRTDLETPVTREFCAECGTHLVTRAPGAPGIAIVKVGTLDDPAAYGGPELAIFVADKQPFHQVPDGIPAFAGAPPRE